MRLTFTDISEVERKELLGLIPVGETSLEMVLTNQIHIRRLAFILMQTLRESPEKLEKVKLIKDKK